MAYMLFSLSVFFIILATAFYITRAVWLPHVADWDLPGSDYLYSTLPSTFSGDIEAGLSSNTFDLQSNLESGDDRTGLDDGAKAEILRIMKRRRLRFDDARKVYIENRFKASGIGPDGTPRDPKFVSF